MAKQHYKPIKDKKYKEFRFCRMCRTKFVYDLQKAKNEYWTGLYCEKCCKKYFNEKARAEQAKREEKAREEKKKA